MKDFTIELTKLEKLLEVNNSMCHNYYYLQYGRIYNADKTQFRRFKFVEWSDIESICDYYEKDFVTKEEIRRCMGEYAWVTCESQADYLIKSFDDCQAFYDWCNETINKYNGKR
jgi:hypothetical protein